MFENPQLLLRSILNDVQRGVDDSAVAITGNIFGAIKDTRDIATPKNILIEVPLGSDREPYWCADVNATSPNDLSWRRARASFNAEQLEFGIERVRPYFDVRNEFERRLWNIEESHGIFAYTAVDTVFCLALHPRLACLRFEIL